MLIEANIGKSSVTVPKTLSWDQITRSTLWKIEDANLPKRKESQNPVQIIEHDDGSVEIKFSEEPSSESKVKEFMSSRPSTSGISRSMYDPLKVKEVSYDKKRASIHYEDGLRSPTHTDMDTQSVTILNFHILRVATNVSCSSIMRKYNSYMNIVDN